MNTSIRSRRALLLALFATATGVARAQNVGVGTLTPSEKLDVVGGNLKLSTAGSRLIFPDGTFQTTAATNATGAGFILNTTTQQATSNFNISGSGTLGGSLTTGGTVVVDNAESNTGTAANFLRFGSGGSGEGIGSKRNAGGNAYALDFYTNYINRLTITNAGRVGIGTIGPAGGLHVATGTGGVGGGGGGGAILNGAAGAVPNLELRGSGTGATTTVPYIDFAENNDVDYSTRLQSVSGTLQVYNTGAANALSVNGGANVTGNATVGTNVFVDGAAGNTGTIANALRLGGSGSGEGIGSKRNGGGNQYGLDFYTLSTNRLSITSTGNVGIGTTAPGQALEVNGNVLIPLNNDYLLRDTNHGLGYYGPGGRLWNGQSVNGPVLYGYAGGVLGTNQFGTRTTALTWNSDGNVGIGTTNPGSRLDVVGGGGNSVNLRVNGRLQTGDGTNQGGVWLNSANSQFVGQFDATKIGVFNGGAWRMVVDDAGKVGIGTTGPSFPLDVQATSASGNYGFGYLNSGGYVGTGTVNGTAVSIRATGRILATEFNATSDRRLKTVVGLSDRATDLALLNRLRITDYTMRDRVQFGNRVFKKVIAQEVEEVFPQAVHQQAGFLPDVYALATAVQALPGDSLVALTLPAPGLPVAATAGQRLKLVGEAGDMLTTLVQPAAVGTRTLTLRRTSALTAGSKVFVYGLEHADVRSVDYEALSMLNVSATQELARKVELLEKQNAALQTGSAADHASLLTLQAQVARLLGEGAQAQK